MLRGWAVGTAVTALLAGLAAPTGAATAATATSTSGAADAYIAVDAHHSTGVVPASVLGQAYLWPFNGMGSFNATSGKFYGKFDHQLKTVLQPGSLRYPGGITAESFHWLRAVGPQAQRTPNAFAPSNGPSPSSVGPDEFGRLLDQTGASGVITTNFGTGSAPEAASFVAYMTGAAGTSKWADMRVADGHAQPYDVPYWEVGNEEYVRDYWRLGDPVAVGGPAAVCQHQVVTCLYIYGGTTRFTRQPAVGYADRTPQASISTGSPGQVFYVAFAPVTASAADPASVYVGGTAWTQVPDLGTAAPTAHDYTLDPSSGAITFGDGLHGAVPPRGAQVTVSYLSGPHDGFVQFYQQMKAANPAVKVCSSDTTTQFIQLMAEEHLPYDCLQEHNYASTGTVANNAPIDTYEQQLMAASGNQARAASQLEATIESYAGHYIPLVETEYGQLLNSNPDGYPFFHESLDEALLNASQLANWIRLGIPVANRQLLAAEIPPSSQCCAGLPAAAPYASTASIGTPGPDTVAEATGELYSEFAPLAGGTLLSTRTLDDPQLPRAGGRVSALSVLSVRKGNSLYLVGINRSPSDAVPGRILLEGLTGTGQASNSVLDGPSPLSYNTPSAPRAVSLRRGEVKARGGEIQVSFPAHSVTTLRIPVKATPSWPLAGTLTAQPAVVNPGSRFTLKMAVANTGNQALSGRAQPIVPSGWSVQPTSATWSAPASGQADVDFQVTAPTGTSPSSFSLGAVLYAPDGSVAGVAETGVTVPYQSLSAAFNNAGISSDTNIDGADFDGVGNSYSEQALAAAGFVPGSTVTSHGVTFGWPDAAAGQPDNVVAQGQTIRLDGHGTQLALIGANSGEATAQGNVTVHYTDGSQTTAPMTLYGFFNAPPGNADQVVVKLPYENSQGIGGRPVGQYRHPVYVFLATVPIDGSRTVSAVTLPSGGTAGAGRVVGMHFFSLALK